MQYHYDVRHRPAQPATPAPDAFEVHRAEVAPGLSLAYIREGIGGVPLVLLHGYPETKRIWWRNIAPLAAAGFEVIAPDLRGAGDSDHPADDQHDIVTYSKDIYALVHDVLGHEKCLVAAGDVGGSVATDFVHRYPGFVEKLCFFNSVAPMGVDYAAAGIGDDVLSGAEDPTADYRLLQGAKPDELAAMLATPEARRLWIAGMYSSRLWASPGTFTAADIDFMTEPFADEARLRAGWAPYQLAYGRAFTDIPHMEAVTVPTLLLYGPDDHVVDKQFIARCEVAFPNRIGPLLIPGAGHFLQWERADIFNALLTAVFAPTTN